jgi:hypothetical protein
MRTWTRGPQPGEPSLRDRDGEWHAALEETEPASEEEYDGQMAGH